MLIFSSLCEHLTSNLVSYNKISQTKFTTQYIYPVICVGYVKIMKCYNYHSSRKNKIGAYIQIKQRVR